MKNTERQKTCFPKEQVDSADLDKHVFYTNIIAYYQQNWY